MDNASPPDLKTLISKTEMIRFMDQLNAISPVPLLVINDDGYVIYENGSMTNGDGTEILGSQPMKNSKDLVW